MAFCQTLAAEVIEELDQDPRLPPALELKSGSRLTVDQNPTGQIGVH